MSVPRSRSGGSVQRDDREAVVEVLSKTPRRAIAACRSSLVAARTHASTGSLRVLPRRLTARSSSALSSLTCSDVRHQADLVEEDRSAMRDLQEAGLGLTGVGERAALEPEELGLEQGVRNGRAVDVDERRVGARAVLWMTWATSPLPVPVSP